MIAPLLLILLGCTDKNAPKVVDPNVNFLEAPQTIAARESYIGDFGVLVQAAQGTTLP
jgi:hypothetical protein